jgi:polynucleotide 5'-kinase involved in rRNA processing
MASIARDADIGQPQHCLPNIVSLDPPALLVKRLRAIDGVAGG